MNLDRIIAVRNAKTVYRDGDKCIKVFDETYSIDGKWAIISDFIKGKTMDQLMKEDPSREKEFLDSFVSLQMEVHSKNCLRLASLKESTRLPAPVDEAVPDSPAKPLVPASPEPVAEPAQPDALEDEPEPVDADADVLEDDDGFAAEPESTVYLAQDDEEQAHEAERLSLLDKAINRLRPEERTLLHLRYYEKRSLGEIAEVMEVATGPLANRLQRIRQKLSKMIKLTIS